MTIKLLFHKINNRWTKLRFQPIQVLAFHQVSDTFDESTMWQCDWTQTEQFKRNILALKGQYTFISLAEAHKHLREDKFRFHKYAVLTADDGWASVLNIIPWLAELQIPITLFLNPQYLDGIHHQERETEKLLTKRDIERIVEEYSPYITIASHGWTHKDCCKMEREEFIKSVQDSERYLSSMNGKIPFYAYTFGHHTNELNKWLLKQCLIPVLVDGAKNYNDITQIHRECIDGH